MPTEAPTAPAPSAPAAPVAPTSQEVAPSITERFQMSDRSRQEMHWDNMLPGKEEAAPEKLEPAPAAKAPELPKEEPKVEKPSETPKAEEKPAETPTEPKVEAEEEIPQFKTNTELRKWAKTQAKAAKEAAAKVKEYEAKMAELEANPKVDEAGPLSEKLTKLQAENEEKELALRMLDFKKSNEYKDRYLKPYNEAVSAAQEVIAEIPALVTDPESGEVKERPATIEDFFTVYNAPTLGQAMKVAKEIFGPDFAKTVVDHRASVLDKAKAAVRAEEEYKSKAAEFEKERVAKTAQERERLGAKHKEIAVKVAKEFENIVEIDPADKEAQKALNDSKTHVAKILGEGRKSMTQEQLMEEGERVKHKLTLYPILQSQVSKLKAEIAEKQKQIDDMRSSGPGKPKVSGEPAPKKRGSFLEDFPA